jgi:lysozyme family protein
VAAINFNKALEYCLIDEKGKDDDPNDPGGRTCDGITQDEYAAWCRIHQQTIGDVWQISGPTRDAIYYMNYWVPWGDRLPSGIDYLWFDINVNSGAHEATLLLQRAMGFNSRQLDGRMGIYTAQRAREWPDQAALIDKLCDLHKDFYANLVTKHPHFAEFERGWYNRVDHERTNAHSLLTSSSPEA